MSIRRLRTLGRRWPASMAIAAAFVLAGCGGGSSAPPPSEGQATIGAAGGTVLGPDGVQLVVPEGALAADTTIRIARSSTGAPALPTELQGNVAVYEFTPHGLRFDQPVTIRLPVTGTPGEDATVLVAEPGGTWDSATPTAGSGYLVIERSSLSWYTHTSRWSLLHDACAPQASDPYSCVYPSLRPEGDITVTPPAAWPTPRGTWPKVVQPASITWPVRITAARDCLQANFTVWRRVVPPGTPVTVFIPYQQVAQQAVNLVPMAGNSKRNEALTTFTAQVAAGDNHAVGLRFVFACTRGFDATRQNAVLETGYVAAVPAPPGAPVISQQPASLSVVEGDRAEFRVVASAPNTLVISWQRSDDGGSTWTTVQTSGDSYALASAQLADNGARFRARVCNGIGVTLNCIDSDVAILTVTSATAAPMFTTQPQSIAVVEGQTASFSVVATGTPTPTVRWHRDSLSNPVGSPCTGGAGSTTCTFTTAPVTLADDGARFFAVASNGTTDATSATATLTVTPAAVAPSIPADEPADVAVTVGQSATFSVNATGTAPLSYQWQRNGSDIPGANAASYTLANAQLADSGARLRVIVSNGQGSVASREATLTVTAPTSSAGICTSSNPAGWCWIRPGPHSNGLSALAIDGTTIRAIGRRTGMRSSDGGATWQTDFDGLDLEWSDLAVSAPGVLVAAAPSGFGSQPGFGLYRSIDGGATWTRVLAERVFAVAFESATTGIAVGSGIWRTADGGATWSVMQAPGVMQLVRVVSPSPGVYVAIGSMLNTPALIMRSVDGGQTWTAPPPGTTDQLVDIAFGSASTGVIAVGIGSVLRTTDGGATWSAPIAVAPFGLHSVAFADAGTVVAMSALGGVFRSTDAGQTWVAGDDLGFAGAEFLARLKFLAATEGYAVGLHGQIWRTADAGLSWSLVAGGSDLESFASVKFRAGEGLAAHGNDVLRTLDGGATWQSLGVTGAFDVALPDASVRVAVGFGIRRSIDRGNTWTPVHTLPGGQLLLAVDFVPSTGGSATTGVAVGSSGSNGLMLRTTDGGQTWAPVTIDAVPVLYAVAFSASNPGLGIAAGAGRTLLRTSDGGATWTPVTMSALDAGETIQAVHFTATGAVLAADGGLYRSVDGGFSWTRVYDSSARGSMLGVTVLSATDVVAVGVSGTIVRSTDAGATWTLVDAPLTVNLSGVAYTGNGSTVVAVGDGGTILRNMQGGAP